MVVDNRRRRSVMAPTASLHGNLNRIDGRFDALQTDEALESVADEWTTVDQNAIPIMVALIAEEHDLGCPLVLHTYFTKRVQNKLAP
ncbi:hypothetical protein V6N13_010068 [Hibiscus sabdariffa]